MQIGNKYSEKKMYSGFRFYDMKPLLHADLHESADISMKKSAYLMNNLLGCGVLNTPSWEPYGVRGIRLLEPAVALIEGDIVLIQTDGPIINEEKIIESGIISGSICIVGWYQHIDSSSRVTNYGGVDNEDIVNANNMHDLVDNKFKKEISTRYQFRWMPILVDDALLSKNDDFGSIDIEQRDIQGDPGVGTRSITIYKKIGNTLIAPKPPAGMEYAESDLYIVPILKFRYDGEISISNHLPLTPKGTSGFIRSEEEPLGEYIEGTLWYNPITREFKTYVVGEGFVGSTSKMAFLQYQSIHTIEASSNSPTIDIGVEEYTQDDILQVTYEGLVLVRDEHYTINDSQSITLKDFLVNAGEKITFTVTKIVEANDITSITALFTEHMRLSGSTTQEGHLKLSDDVNDSLNASRGVAATPKSVYEAKYMTDNTTGIKYKFGVDNGLLYIEEG